jgi:preprotein translocase subunit SecB
MQKILFNFVYAPMAMGLVLDTGIPIITLINVNFESLYRVSQKTQTIEILCCTYC